MPGHRICRRIAFQPDYTYFKPAGIRGRDLKSVDLALEELEALRLKDYLDLGQKEAAWEMGVSQPTFHRVLEEARKKVAKALIDCSLLRIEKMGSTEVCEQREKRIFGCAHCGYAWPIDYGEPRPLICPTCGSNWVRRAEEKGKW